MKYTLDSVRPLLNELKCENTLKFDYKKLLMILKNRVKKGVGNQNIFIALSTKLNCDDITEL